MKLTQLITKDTIKLHLDASSKSAVIEELVDVLNTAGKLNNRDAYRDAIVARENQSTTGLGEEIAIPHAKTDAVKTPAICFGRSASGVDYEALDGQPSKLFFMIAASADAHNAHLETLSKLSVMLMQEAFRTALSNAQTPDEVLAILEEAEKEEEKEAQPIEIKADAPYVLAVTACPTGIAHTYMAADALKQKAEEMNIGFKVETNGSTGIKNALTADEIARATAIIVAADKQVEMDRFAGKHVIIVPVAQGIRKTEELLNRAVTKDAPVYQVSGEKTEVKSERSGFYKHLMSGVSAMLPLVVAGGLLIAFSFIFGANAFDPNDPT
ncbi:MAG: fructose PTS transporter subunit IIA, partial [Bacilli bacterium]